MNALLTSKCVEFIGSDVERGASQT
jgi:hypothetical protein